MAEIVFGEEKTDYSNETFIDIAVDNFSDSAVKEIYSMQKYANILQSVNPHVYSKILHCPNHNESEDEFVQFMVTENEKIFCLKGTGFAIAITDLLMRKYERLIREINYEGDHVQYEISIEALAFFQKELANINWHKIRLESFYTEDSVEDLVKFDKYVSEKYIHYQTQTKKFANVVKLLPHASMLKMLDSEFMTITTCVLHLKEVTELSDDVKRTAIIIRQIIDLVVLTHFIMKTISIKKDTEER